jgi:hypothetical protein
MRVMSSMELTDEEQLDATCPMPMSNKPKWPYGLRVCLTKAELEKLRLDPSVAFVGGIVHLHAIARITSVSANEYENAQGETVSEPRIELQIEDMAIESEDEENEMMERKRPSPKALYDRSR